MQTSRIARAGRQACYSTLPALRSLPRNHATTQVFELTFLAAGREWKAIAAGNNTEAAAQEALITLSYHYPDFEPSTARLVSAVQVR